MPFTPLFLCFEEPAHHPLIAKEQDYPTADKGWRWLQVAGPRPDPVHNRVTWSVGIAIALLFLLQVLYFYLVHHR